MKRSTGNRCGLRRTLLGTLACSIRQRFIDCRSLRSGQPDWSPGPRWDGGEIKGKQYSSTWLKAAKLVAKRQLPADAYVKFVVFECGFRPDPTPNVLLSLAMAAAFEKELRSDPLALKRSYQISFGAQQNSIMLRLEFYEEALAMGFFGGGQKQVRRAALLDPQVDASALLLYCLAHSEQLNDLAESFYMPAAAQYICERALYDEVWRPCIPNEFKRRTRRGLAAELSRG